MAGHDDYGKRVRAQASAGACSFYGESVETNHGIGGACRIDGAVGDIAVEIEARTGKQVRGAILDLICHRYPKKLLVLLPINMNVQIEGTRCTTILRRFCADENFRVVVLSGHAREPSPEGDIERVKEALRELGFPAETQ